MDISIVTPVHNEQENLENFYSELKPVLDSLKKEYEIIFVDDGSTDSSFRILKEIAKKDKTVRIIKLKTNYGQTIALAAGIENSKGNIVVTIDSDLQHNPADIPKMLKELKNADVVIARRIWKKRSLCKKIPSLIANFLIRKITKVRLKDSVGGFKAFKRDVINDIPLYGNLHRYFPILATWKGFHVSDVPVIIRPRKKGKTHYGISRLFSGLLDLFSVKFLVSYSQRPIYLFGTTGLLIFLVGLFVDLWLTLRKILFKVPIGNSLLLFILGILLLVLGIFFWFFGLLADMISFDSIISGKRKIYVIEKII